MARPARHRLSVNNPLSGKADLAADNNGQGGLAGSILSTASMEGEDKDPGLCPTIETITPTTGMARLTGSLQPGTNAMSISVKETQTIATGRLKSCPSAATIPAPTAEFAVALHTDTLQRRPDGSFHAADTKRTVQAEVP